MNNEAKEKCPICEGKGELPSIDHSENDKIVGYKTCPTCKGTRLAQEKPGPTYRSFEHYMESTQPKPLDPSLEVIYSNSYNDGIHNHERRCAESSCHNRGLEAVALAAIERFKKANNLK